MMGAHSISRRAFSLFEVLIALGLVTVLTVGVFAFTENLGRARARIDRISESDATLAAIGDRLGGALLVCHGGTGGEGFKGNAESIDVLTHGPVTTDRDGFERFRLAWANGSLRVNNTAIAGGERFERVQFRYLRDRTWYDTHDGVEFGLPLAVEMAVWFAGDEPDTAEPASSEIAPTDPTDPLDLEAALAASPDEMETTRPADRVRVFPVPGGGSADEDGLGDAL